MMRSIALFSGVIVLLVRKPFSRWIALAQKSSFDERKARNTELILVFVAAALISAPMLKYIVSHN